MDDNVTAAAPARLFAVLLLVVSLARPMTLSAQSQGRDAAASPRTVRVAGLVLKWRAGEPDVNYQRAERLIRQAAAGGAKIVATAESFLDGYSARDPSLEPDEFRATAERIPGGTYYERLSGLTKELGIYLVASIPELDGVSVYNTAVVLGPGGELVGKYRKRILWPGEKHAYTPGDLTGVFDTSFGRVGVMICYERQFTQPVRELAAAGADVVFCPSGGGYGESSDRTMQQRSRESGLPIVYTHPVEFLVTGADGSVLAREIARGTLDDVSGSHAGSVEFYDLVLESQE